jgi:hypothetical protein
VRLNAAPQPVGSVGAKWSYVITPRVCGGGGSMIQVLLASRGSSCFGRMHRSVAGHQQHSQGVGCGAQHSNPARCFQQEGGLLGRTQHPSLFMLG